MAFERRVEHGAGFVYIPSNSAMPGMVKIGLTRNEAAARAVELSRATGVPTDFELVYDELVNDCRAVERSLHKRFSEYRVNDRREFFRVPIRQAIAALQEEAKAYPVIPLAEERIDILPRLEQRCRRWLRRDLVGAYIIQTDGLVYRETVFQPHVALNDRETQRLDLGFIYSGDEPDFSCSKPIADNAQRFLNLDAYTIHMVTDLFNDETHQFVETRHRLQEEMPFQP
jgi:T5orf172 domain